MSYDRTTLAALLDRVKAATGPDEALAVEINEALGIASYITDDGDPTESIDGALALTDRVLPGCWWIMAKGKVTASEPLYGCELVFGEEETLGLGEGHTAPLAILAATLQALTEADGNKPS